ncbi:MAG: peptide-methionine (S)-S-oxide reductase MsrA [Oscillospiraceae bacterium]|nr:peptide-methionine (S)-S-oxide reductase MsrA [Oscillospiraceae bacterium]
MKEIYLAGGCYWGVQKYCDNIRGVLSTEVGFANGRVDNPYYALVKKGDTGYAETVKVVYGDSLPLRALLRLFFRIIDPTVLDRQGHDVGNQYRTGVYFTDPADEPIIREELSKLAESCNLPVVTECAPLRNFYTAEEYHQKYLDKNPGGYCHVPLSAIDWVKGVDPNDYAQ